jgi:hypothetical protein
MKKLEANEKKRSILLCKVNTGESRQEGFLESLSLKRYLGNAGREIFERTYTTPS